MRTFMGRRLVIAAAMLGLVAIVATGSVVLAATVRQGAPTYMKVVTEIQSVHAETTTWSDVPGTAIAMSVPQGEHDIFQVSFSTAAPSCVKIASGYSTTTCSVRAVVDGQPAQPGEINVGDSYFQVQDVTASFQWVSGALAPGTHYVKMQYRVAGSGNSIGLTTRTMTVIQARAY